LTIGLPRGMKVSKSLSNTPYVRPKFTSDWLPTVALWLNVC